MKTLRPLILLLLLASYLAPWRLAQAAFAMDYCSSYAAGSHPDGLAVGDVTFGVDPNSPAPADDCWGVKEKNDNISTDELSGLWADPQAGLWELLIKDENTGSGSSSASGVVWKDILWKLDAATASGSAITGDYDLSWVEQVAGALPASFDFMVVLKGGSAWAGYFFDDIAFAKDGSGSGVFSISWCGKNSGSSSNSNKPDKQAKQTTDTETEEDKCVGNGFSHLSIYARIGGSEEPPVEPPTGGVPVPGTLALLGIGLIGIRRALMSRRA